jgi:hypothetical protein
MLTPWHLHFPANGEKHLCAGSHHGNQGNRSFRVKLAQKLQINFRVLGLTPQSTFDMIFAFFHRWARTGVPATSPASSWWPGNPMFCNPVVGSIHRRFHSSGNVVRNLLMEGSIIVVH